MTSVIYYWTDPQQCGIYLLTPQLPDQICNSPHCQPYNSYNVISENFVLDQLIISKLIFFLYSHYLSVWFCIDIVRRNSVLVTHGSLRVKGWQTVKWCHYMLLSNTEKLQCNNQNCCTILRFFSLIILSIIDDFKSNLWHLKAVLYVLWYYKYLNDKLSSCW